MSRAFASLVTLAWSLWFGGMVFLFVALGTIFSTPGADAETSGRYAARLFPNFERMQLAFAAVALLGTFGWYLAARRGVKLVLFTLFALATVAAVVETTLVTPRVEELRVTGQRGTPQFQRMHRVSSRVYMAGAAVLLVAGLVLPAAVRSDSPKGRTGTGGTHGFPVEGNGHAEAAPASLEASHAAPRG